MNAYWHNLKIKNRQNNYLSALLRETSNCEKFESSKNLKNPLVIVCHGFTGSKEGGGQAVAMGDKLAEIGFKTLLFDFSGCGQSEGKWENLTLSSQVEDLASVVIWCRETGFEQIVLTGRSFGGSTILLYASRDKKIKAFCTWAAVARPDRLFLPLVEGNLEGPAEEMISIENEEGKVKLTRNFFFDLFKHNLLDCAATIRPRELLIIHGSADESVPPEEARLIYNTAGEPKRIEIIEGADHRFTNHIEQVWDIFFGWLKNIKFS